MKLSFVFETELIEFNVKYSKRKTLSIKIEPPGIITVSAPQAASEESILKIVRNRAGWILEKLHEIEAREELRKTHHYSDGEDFLYLGLNYELRIIIDKTVKKPHIRLEEDLVYITINDHNPDKIKAALEEWYRKKALEKVTERIEYYTPIIKMRPNKVVVKEQKKRWGSCNSRKELYFNWRIIMAPVKILDYVVVHEMCHMVHLNHSKNFWELVSAILPDYKERKLWLRENGITLNL